VRVAEQCTGSPLFLVPMVDQLVERGAVRPGPGGWRLEADGDRVLDELPRSLVEFVRREVDALREGDRAALEAASIGGGEFVAREVAGVLALPDIDAERACDRLADHGGLVRQARDAGWAGGTRARRYAFAHAVYQRIVADGVGPLRQAQMHLRLAES